MVDKDLQKLTQDLGYTFNNIELLQQALCHRSYGPNNNERLEFLGDAILGFIISIELYQRHPEAKEGELSRMRSLLVNRETLADLATTLQLYNYIYLGPGERKSGGDKRHSTLADVVEALLGAIYLDAGMDACRSCILHLLNEKITGLQDLPSIKDPKSTLQEWLQAHKLPLPNYEATTSGKAHEQVFTVICTVAGLPHQTTGISSNRRSAEQIAAEHFLECLHDN